VRSISAPKLLKIVSIFCWHLSSPLQADLQPEHIHNAKNQKNQLYFNDALFVGGDGNLRGILVRSITCAPQEDHERIAILVELNRNGEPTSISRPPYYQVSIETKSSPVLTISIWGNPQLNFDAKKVQASFQTIRSVQKLYLLPKLEEDNWTFSMTLSKKSALEVYELSNPARIVLDIRNDELSAEKKTNT